MKDISKCMAFLLVGLLVAILIYPFLHEAGHSLAALLQGARIIEFHLFPMPYIVCDMDRSNQIGVTLVGLSGLFFPLFFAWVIHAKSFWVQYGLFVIKGICLLSFLNSIISIILYRFGIIASNEDAVTILKMLNRGEGGLLLIVLLGATITVILIKKEHPFRKMMAYVGIK